MSPMPKMTPNSTHKSVSSAPAHAQGVGRAWAGVLLTSFGAHFRGRGASRGRLGKSWEVSWVSSVSPGRVNINKDLPSDWTLVLALPVEHCLKESAPKTRAESVRNASLAIFPMTFACARWDLIWRSCWHHFGPIFAP